MQLREPNKRLFHRCNSVTEIRPKKEPFAPVSAGALPYLSVLSLKGSQLKFALFTFRHAVHNRPVMLLFFGLPQQYITVPS